MLLVLFLVAGFAAIEALGYAVHRMLHSSWSGSLNQVHLRHHHEIYPPHQFLSDRYLPASAGGGGSDAWRFAVPGALLGLGLFWVLPWTYALFFVAELAIVGFGNSYIHDSLHVRDHWLTRFKAYHRWRLAHFAHHVRPDVNYGIVTFTADKACGTFLKPYS